jgi:hypothetical protein
MGLLLIAPRLIAGFEVSNQQSPGTAVSFVPQGTLFFIRMFHAINRVAIDICSAGAKSGDTPFSSFLLSILGLRPCSRTGFCNASILKTSVADGDKVFAVGKAVIFVMPEF